MSKSQGKLVQCVTAALIFSAVGGPLLTWQPTPTSTSTVPKKETKISGVFVKTAKADPLPPVQVTPIAVPVAQPTGVRNRDALLAALVPANPVDEAIFKAADEFGIRRDMFWAQMKQESAGFAPDVLNGSRRSVAGAMGLSQIMPGTLPVIIAWMNDNGHPIRQDASPFDVNESARMGAAYLREMLNRFDQDYMKAMKAYNAGPGNWNAGFQETENYWKIISASADDFYDDRANRPEFNLLFKDNKRITQGINGGYGHTGSAWDNGIDVTTDSADKTVHAQMNGIVYDIKWAESGYIGGNTVFIKSPSGRFEISYGHLNVVNVKIGEWVDKGTPIGIEGATGVASGPHVHNTVLERGQVIDQTK